MGFPKAPKKRVSGVLRLVARPPVSSEEEPKFHPEDEFKGTKDFSSSLQFKLPRGFSISEDHREMTEKQGANALLRLDELKKKAGGCCGRTVDIKAVEAARLLVLQVGTYLNSLTDTHATIAVGNQKDGAVSVDVTVQNRLLAFIVYPSRLLVGRYFDGALVEEYEMPTTVPEVGCLQWLVGT